MIMEAVSFRPAAIADLPGIISMLADDELGQQREDSSSTPNEKYYDAFSTVDSDENQILAVAEAEGVLLGCLQITFIPGLSRLGMWRGQIESVRIAADSRGKGIGRKMFMWAIGECRRRGCGLVQLTTDKSRTGTFQFYESLRFKATHEGMKLAL
jgi:ribosomal protein S18 acetylase RimI-like enzyme